MTRVVVLAAVLLAMAGCGTTPLASSGGSSGGTPAANASATPDRNSTDSGACDGVASVVHDLVPGTSDHTTKNVGGFELCKWESAQGSPTGRHYFLQVTVAGQEVFSGLASGLDQSMTYMSGVKKLAPGGFDRATGFWNAPTHTFSLLVERGAHSALLEGSVPQEPSIDALVGIAHTLVG